MTTTDCECPGVRLSRRGALTGMALGGAALMVGSTAVTFSGSAAATGPVGAGTIVVLSLRGAADGLSLVVPHGDPTYYLARPRIAVPAAALLQRDGFFGLHPALQALEPLWTRGEVAAIHATGLRIPNRSHFAAIEEVEDADPGSAARTGWLNRLIGVEPTGHPLQAVSVGGTPPAALAGGQPFMSIASLETDIAGTGRRNARIRSLHTLWDRHPSPMGDAWRTTMAGAAALGPAKQQPDRAAAYPRSDLGEALATVARTVRGRVGTGVVTVDSGGWDLHTGVGTVASGQMATLTKGLAGAVAAFFDDLGPQRSTVTMVVMSEFGRRVQENASGGLDHGWGNVMLVLGAGVRGGYYGRWTPLANSLDADVAVTTDYRDVLAEVVAARTTASTAQVFPGFQRTRIGFMHGQ